MYKTNSCLFALVLLVTSGCQQQVDVETEKVDTTVEKVDRVVDDR